MSRCSRLDSWMIPMCSGLDLLIVPAFCSGSALHRALQMGRGSKSGQNILLSFLTQYYYPHTSRQSVSYFFIIQYISPVQFMSLTNNRTARHTTIGLLDIHCPIIGQLDIHCPTNIQLEMHGATLEHCLLLES